MHARVDAAKVNARTAPARGSFDPDVCSLNSSNLQLSKVEMGL